MILIGCCTIISLDKIIFIYFILYSKSIMILMIPNIMPKWAAAYGVWFKQESKQEHTRQVVFLHKNCEWRLLALNVYHRCLFSRQLLLCACIHAPLGKKSLWCTMLASKSQKFRSNITWQALLDNKPWLGAQLSMSILEVSLKTIIYLTFNLLSLGATNQGKQLFPSRISSKFALSTGTAAIPSGMPSTRIYLKGCQGQH